MQSTPCSPESAPAVVRLSLGSAALVMGAHLLFAGLRGLLNIWIALTPGKDRQWQTLRSRA